MTKNGRNPPLLHQLDTLIYLWLRGRDYASIALG